MPAASHAKSLAMLAVAALPLVAAGQYQTTPYWGDGSDLAAVVTGSNVPASYRLRGGTITPSVQLSASRSEEVYLPPYYWRDPADMPVHLAARQGTSPALPTKVQRQPKDIPVVVGVVPADPAAVASGLQCAADPNAGRVGQLACSRAGSRPASRRGRERVALVVVGEVKASMESVVQDSAYLLVSPLRRDFGDDGVDIYMCVEPPYAANFAPPWHYGGLVPVAVFQHTSTSMADRLSQCWQDVMASSRGARGYKWVIRSRPDVVWYRPLPSITEWPTDAVYTRARRVGMMYVEDEKLSWWKYKDPDNGSCDLACKWRDTGMPTSGEKASCAVADDQFAVIPAEYAGNYFGTTIVDNPSTHYPMPVGHQRCEWAEGKITCQILDSGARLMIAPFSFRINRWRYTHGLGPPFTQPSKFAGVCPCRHCG